MVRKAPVLKIDDESGGEQAPITSRPPGIRTPSPPNSAGSKDALERGQGTQVRPSSRSPRTSIRPVRPVLQRFYSLPENPARSPMRHHFRLSNAEPHLVIETPKIDYLEDANGRFVNQYKLTRSIGRGKYGRLWEATDPEGQIFAIKECSKLRLAKLNHRILMLKRRQGDRHFDLADLIRREIAVMKKIDHPNLVSLYEVLDDPDSDALYLVIEWCSSGCVVNGGQLDEEQCRLYFRDMLLGVEYLHSRGIAHRDIKADNVLLNENDVLKLADFGVAEIFNASTDAGDTVKERAGSPAYMAPELVSLFGAIGPKGPTPRVHVSGRKADIWAMGVTLYLMIFQCLPFQGNNLLELDMSILEKEPSFPPNTSPDLVDFLERLLKKDPQERITLAQMREHPWVTHGGEDPLLSYEENVDVENEDPVTEEDLVSAVEQLHLSGSQEDLENYERFLRKNYGWRPSSRSVSHSRARSHSRAASHSRTESHSIDDCTSTESLSPMSASSLAPAQSEDGQRDTHYLSKLNKLTRALDEITRMNGWAGTNTGE